MRGPRTRRHGRAAATPPELAHVSAAAAPPRARDVFVYFIGAAKVRNPAAAIALIERLRKAAN